MKKDLRKYIFKTFSGIKINTKKPTKKDILLSDIACGLAKICRFAGQLPGTYSVAAHSICVSYWIERHGGTPLEALTGLLHDASEAYCGDVPSPIKRQSKSYQIVENRFQKAIAKKFGLIYPFPDIVHKGDMTVLFNEKLFQAKIASSIDMANRNVEKLFINRFKELGGKE